MIRFAVVLACATIAGGAAGLGVAYISWVVLWGPFGGPR